MRRVRPAGQPTRGKTALNRLRRVDVYMALAHTGALRAGAPLVVDVGYGAHPWTTLEMRARWLAHNPRIRVLGVEIDPARVAAALPFADPPAVEFKLGGFNLIDVLEGRPAHIIRAFNVLRQYEASAVGGALSAMAAALSPGGLLVEGTSTPTGGLVAFDVYQKNLDGGGLAHLALVFGTNLRAEVNPADFQTILPKRLIHHALDPRPAAFFEAWRAAYARARRAWHTPRGWRYTERWLWQLAAWWLAEKFGWPVARPLRLVRRGFVVLRDPLIPPPIGG